MIPQNSTSPFVSSTELARLLGVSRVNIFNRIKRGEIKAIKVGRNFVINKNDLPDSWQHQSEINIEDIDDAVKKRSQNTVKRCGCSAKNNGNKRIALATLFVFLYRNKKWLRVDNQEFYNFAKWVAQSNPKLKDETVRAAERFIGVYLVEVKLI